MTDLNDAVTQLQQANSDLLSAVDDATSRVTNHLAALQQQVTALQDQIAQGQPPDPATVQSIKDAADAIESQVASLQNLDPAPVPQPPAPQPPAPGPTPGPAPIGLTISTDLAPATAGQAYSASLSATGGTAPYVWSISGLPDGLEADVDGNITGTAATAGAFGLSVGVVDETNTTASAQVTLTVQ